MQSPSLSPSLEARPPFSTSPTLAALDMEYFSQRSPSASFDSISSSSTLLSTDHSVPDSHQEDKPSPVNPKCLGYDPWQQHDLPDLLPNTASLAIYDTFRRTRSSDNTTSKGRNTGVHARSLSVERGRKTRQSQTSKLEVYEQQSLARSQSLDQGRDVYRGHWEMKFPEPGPAPFPTTDPKDTALLWELVSMPDNQNSRGGSLVEPKEAPGYMRMTRSSNAKTKTSSTQSNRPTKATPRDRQFEERILEPRRITKIQGDSLTAHAHFETEEAQGSRVEYYTKLNQGISSCIWLEKDDALVNDIVREYECMVHNSMCEAEYATYAKEAIFKRDPRSIKIEEKRRFMAERVVELTATPQITLGHKWRPPPFVGFTSAMGDTSWNDYDFNLRPDCAYWLSIQAFNPEYMSQVQSHVHVIMRRMTSPYLTIEFKKDDTDDFVAENQVAAASALALYNRYCLRAEALRVSGRAWNPSRSNNLRHYCLTLKAATYAVWVTRATLTKDWAWAGCELRKEFQGDLLSPASVRHFIDWVNEIHRWGLTVHGPGVEGDVKYCIQPDKSRIQTSDVAPDLEAS